MHVIASHSVRLCVLCSAAIIYWLIYRNYGECVWLKKCLGWDLLLCSHGHNVVDSAPVTHATLRN